MLGEANCNKQFLNDNYFGKTMFIDDFPEAVKFEVWGACAIRKCLNINKIYFKNAIACILVYDITNKESFDELKNYWIDVVKEYGHKDISKKKINI